MWWRLDRDGHLRLPTADGADWRLGQRSSQHRDDVDLDHLDLDDVHRQPVFGFGRERLLGFERRLVGRLELGRHQRERRHEWHRWHKWDRRDEHGHLRLGQRRRRAGLCVLPAEPGRLLTGARMRAPGAGRMRPALPAAHAPPGPRRMRRGLNRLRA